LAAGARDRLGTAGQAHGTAGEASAFRQTVCDTSPDVGRVRKAMDEEQRYGSIADSIGRGIRQQTVRIAIRAFLPGPTAQSHPEHVEQIRAEPSRNNDQ